MLKRTAILCLLAGTAAATAQAQKHDNSQSIPHQDHVIVIMMENHGYQQIINNPNEPYLNSLIAKGRVSLAKNYFAVGHPSLTNYLEVIGGSNFGVRSDNPPNWGSKTCTPNLQSGSVNADADAPPPSSVQIETGSICPIAGTGTDAATPAVDTWNETEPGIFNFLADIDGVKSVPAATTVGETIADQLVRVGKSWKSYQESLPLGPVFGVNFSNGTVSNLDFDANGNNSLLAPLTSKNVVQAYAVKHNPFAYFRSVQEGTWDNNSLENVVGFDGPRGLYADLATGNVPNFAFVAPNQCDDQHGRSQSPTGEQADAFCAFDPGLPPGDLTVGTQAGLNPALIRQGDTAIERIVRAIHASPVWHQGRSAIVIVWDENDYSGLLNAPNGLFPSQNQNTVVLTVETNDSDNNGVQSNKYYNSFSLLKSLEAAFGLPCLNHACDPGVSVMTDLFGRDHD
ncbi:MAG TPA: alkaline phosphatase family protein [Candidatus Bathyarchaeia archaeon]|nr:alkaline phosphatase family protein [Candidatus Bathyarchaeia archaeon]